MGHYDQCARHTITRNCIFYLRSVNGSLWLLYCQAYTVFTHLCPRKKTCNVIHSYLAFIPVRYGFWLLVNISIFCQYSCCCWLRVKNLPICPKCSPTKTQSDVDYLQISRLFKIRSSTSRCHSCTGWAKKTGTMFLYVDNFVKY